MFREENKGGEREGAKVSSTINYKTWLALGCVQFPLTSVAIAFIHHKTNFGFILLNN